MTPPLSITSTPLLLLSKLRNKTNPYAQPHHPLNHSHTEPTACHAPAHTDLLAQAREAAGRDRVTGRLVGGGQQGDGQGSQRSSSEGRSRAGKGKGKATVHEGGAGERAEAEEQKKAYLAWAARDPEGRGRPYACYEEFVREKVGRRGVVEGEGEGEREQKWVRGEFYAPETE